MDHHALGAVPGRLDHLRASDLLSRYPDLDPEEVRELLTFLRFGRYGEVSLVTGNARLQPKLDAFLKDHWVHPAARQNEDDAVIGAIILLLFVGWAVWASFA